MPKVTKLTSDTPRSSVPLASQLLAEPRPLTVIATSAGVDAVHVITDVSGSTSHNHPNIITSTRNLVGRLKADPVVAARLEICVTMLGLGDGVMTTGYVPLSRYEPLTAPLTGGSPHGHL